MANIKNAVKLGVFTLAIMNVTAVVSLRLLILKHSCQFGCYERCRDKEDNRREKIVEGRTHSVYDVHDMSLANNKYYTLVVVLIIYWLATFISLKGKVGKVREEAAVEIHIGLSSGCQIDNT